MRKPLLALATMACALPASASAIEVQAWKTANSHIHTIDCVQQFQTISAPLRCPLTTLLHNSDETVTFTRWSDYSSVIQSIPMLWWPGVVGEATRTDTLTLDPARIARTAEGNPLFLEQLVATQRERGETETLPPTIQAVLAARILDS